ncbi:Hypothetical protein NTJ_05284 [Nesidiocoris tenuis]|uniref:Uncharacterized protein n=1 Tax=Nesidiocoris tenuis TaxID=355587 RepID=A0ABN7ANJ1_9HEMI|nr:Hypothetical protein NTJ_05284 [Nesidiocoris tenuis]
MIGSERVVGGHHLVVLYASLSVCLTAVVFLGWQNIQLNGRMNALEERLDRLASAAAAPSRSAGAPPPIFREKRDAAFGDGPDCACPPG